MDDPKLHRIVDLNLEQRLFEGLDGTRDITLNDEVERLDLALFERAREVLERDALASLGKLSITLHGFTLLGDLTGRAVLVGDEESIAGARHTGQTLHLNRARWSCLGNGCPVLIGHRANAAVRGARNDGVSHS